jgi:hypothetical protein
MSECDTMYANIIRQNAHCSNKWKWHTKAKDDIMHDARPPYGCEGLNTCHDAVGRIEQLPHFGEHEHITLSRATNHCRLGVPTQRFSRVCAMLGEVRRDLRQDATYASKTSHGIFAIERRRFVCLVTFELDLDPVI